MQVSRSGSFPGSYTQMQTNDIDQEPEEKGPDVSQDQDDTDQPEHPAPGIEHYPEPDAENIMPAEDQPGTL